jgi:hypothetical protein
VLFASACSQPPDFTVDPVQEGFRNVGGYKESGTNTPRRFVDRFVNEGPATRSATFIFVLREEDGRVAWTGRATVTDIEPGEEFEVTYDGSTQPPDGDQYTQWRVEDIVR